jgi:hypothetical protein
MIFLSKGKEDEYVNMLADSGNLGTTNTADFVYTDSTDSIILRGILKHKIMKQCWKDKRTFFYVDTGYFGNTVSLQNPGGCKHWHRIVKNDLQHGIIVQRPGDRFEKFRKMQKPWNKNGRSILIAVPDEKPCKFYGISKDQWVTDTVQTIKQYTDRPIVIRQRTASRYHRTVTDTLTQALDRDIFALVTFNSTAAVESVFHGIPAFTLAPTHAASPVSLQDLTLIDTPYYATTDKLYAWASHLAYGQFHISELKNGKALEMIND